MYKTLLLPIKRSALRRLFLGSIAIILPILTIFPDSAYANTMPDNNNARQNSAYAYNHQNEYDIQKSPERSAFDCTDKNTPALPDILVICLETADSGRFSPECTDDDIPSLPEHILTDLCTSGIPAIRSENNNSERFYSESVGADDLTLPDCYSFNIPMIYSETDDSDRFSPECAYDDASVLSEQLFANLYAPDFSIIRSQTADSDRFSSGYADGEYLVPPCSCVFDILAICSENTDFSRLFPGCVSGDYLTHSECILSDRCTSDISAVFPEIVDYDGFSPESADVDDPSLPDFYSSEYTGGNCTALLEHILTDFCISDVAAVCCENTYSDRFSLECADDDTSTLSEELLSDFCIPSTMAVCPENADSDRFSPEYADEIDPMPPEYILTDSCTFDIPENCFENIDFEGFVAEYTDNDCPARSEYILSEHCTSDISVVFLENTDCDGFSLECAYDDTSTLPEKLLTDSCIPDTMAIRSENADSGDFSLVCADGEYLVLPYFCTSNIPVVFHEITDSDGFSPEYTDDTDPVLPEHILTDSSTSDVAVACPENADSDRFSQECAYDDTSVLSEQLFTNLYAPNFSAIRSQTADSDRFSSKCADVDDPSLSEHILTDSCISDIPVFCPENTDSGDSSSEYTDCDYTDEDDPALWHLTFCLPDGEIQEHTISMSLTGPSDDPTLPEYILTDPYIPVELLANAASVPILHRKIYEKDVLLWPTTPVAFVFIANHPEIISISSPDNKTTRHFQPLSPKIITSNFTLPLPYLDPLGFTYNTNYTSKRIIIYLVNPETDSSDVVWQAVYPMLVETLRVKSICIASAIISFSDADISISREMYLYAEGMHGRRLGRKLGCEGSENFCGEDAYILCEISPGKRESDNMATLVVRVMQGEYPDVLPEIFVVK